jgi:hypothetical protein
MAISACAAHPLISVSLLAFGLTSSFPIHSTLLHVGFKVMVHDAELVCKLSHRLVVGVEALNIQLEFVTEGGYLL